MSADIERYRNLNDLLELLKGDKVRNNMYRIKGYLEKLGKYDATSYRKIFDDPAYLQQTISSLESAVERYRHRQALKDDIYNNRFDRPEFGTAEGIRSVEKSLELPITGDLQQLIQNYNYNYYTPNCPEYVDPDVCLEKAAQSGDLEALQRGDPTRNPSAIINALVGGGHEKLIPQLYPDMDTTKYVCLAAALHNREDLFNTAIKPLSEKLRAAVPFTPEQFDLAAQFMDIVGGAAAVATLAGHVNFLRNAARVYSAMSSQTKDRVIKTHLGHGVSYNAGVNGDPELIKAVRSLGLYESTQVFDGAISGCKTSIIDSVFPEIQGMALQGSRGQMDRYYSILNNHLASSANSGCAYAVDKFLRAGASIDDPIKLQIAAENGYTQVFERLKQHPDKLKITNQDKVELIKTMLQNSYFDTAEAFMTPELAPLLWDELLDGKVTFIQALDDAVDNLALFNILLANGLKIDLVSDLARIVQRDNLILTKLVIIYALGQGLVLSDADIIELYQITSDPKIRSELRKIRI